MVEQLQARVSSSRSYFLLPLVLFLFLSFLLNSIAVSAVQVPLISQLPLLSCATVLTVFSYLLLRTDALRLLLIRFPFSLDTSSSPGSSSNQSFANNSLVQLPASLLKSPFLPSLVPSIFTWLSQLGSGIIFQASGRQKCQALPNAGKKWRGRRFNLGLTLAFSMQRNCYFSLNF